MAEGSNGRLIKHMALPDEWAAALDSGEYTMSTRGRTLAEEGFIHCSYHDQLVGVASNFYGDVDELVLLTIDTSLVDAPIRDEPPAPGADQRFPHIYGKLPVAAVVATHAWRRKPDGWPPPPG